MELTEAIGTLLCRNILKCRDLPLILEWLELPYIPHEEQRMDVALEMQIVRESYGFKNLTYGQKSNWPNHPEHRQGEIRMVWAHLPTFLSLDNQHRIYQQLISSNTSW